MPFFDTELWLADVAADGALVAAAAHRRRQRRVAAQPQWSPDGQLCVVSDRSGWWNLYRVEAHDALEPLCPMPAEFAHPQWVFGQSMYGFNGPNEIVATCIEQGVAGSAASTLRRGRWTPIATEFTDFDEMRVGPGLSATVGRLADGAAPGRAHRSRAAARTPCWQAASTTCPTPDSSRPRRASSSRARRAQRARLLLPADASRLRRAARRAAAADRYQPRRPDFVDQHEPAPERPLLDQPRLCLVDVNYGGSNGYGRAYANCCTRAWGIVDVEDCVAAARHLAERGLVDASAWRSAARAPAASRRCAR